MSGHTENAKAPAVIEVVEIVGVSKESWRDAAWRAIVQAAETHRHVTGLDVLHRTTVVRDGRIVEYRVSVKLGVSPSRPASINECRRDSAAPAAGRSRRATARSPSRSTIHPSEISRGTKMEPKPRSAERSSPLRAWFAVFSLFSVLVFITGEWWCLSFLTFLSFLGFLRTPGPAS